MSVKISQAAAVRDDSATCFLIFLQHIVDVDSSMKIIQIMGFNTVKQFIQLMQMSR